MQGITFLDIFPILRDPIATETLITNFVYHLTSDTIPKAQNKKIDVIVGLDARGFIFGPLVALRLGAAFVPVRKKGKLPGQCASAVYEKEYGQVRLWAMQAGTVLMDVNTAQDTFEMQADAIKPGQTVVVIDDLIATGKAGSPYVCPTRSPCCRWICQSCWRVSRETGRTDTRVSLHH